MLIRSLVIAVMVFVWSERGGGVKVTSKARTFK
jgi:hypothetical protein